MYVALLKTPSQTTENLKIQILINERGVYKREGDTGTLRTMDDVLPPATAAVPTQTHVCNLPLIVIGGEEKMPKQKRLRWDPLAGRGVGDFSRRTHQCAEGI